MAVATLAKLTDLLTVRLSENRHNLKSVYRKKKKLDNMHMKKNIG
jgi:hypothetical protein